jgi:DNA helicase-2/ATP-dependent DNA helicase PcrA
MNYTGSQKKAIATVDRNLQIIACAGSGKTQVVSERVVGILEGKRGEGVAPGNVVAFTFTDKAAGELKDRIHRLCKEQLGTDQGLAEMFVGTIHSYCLGLLQSPPLYRYLKYSILTDVQQRLLIDRYSSQSGLTHVPLRGGGKLARWKDSRLYQQLLGILNEGNVDWGKVPVAVREAVGMYQELRDSKRYLDYSMIIAEAVAELKTNDTLRERISSQLKYLIVDEYQDVNPLQEMLIRELHDLGANLCVVGDDDQTVYQWRSSEVRNIIEFANRYPQVVTVPLNENFRSSDGVVVSARHVIENNPDRLPKRMESTAAQPFERGDVLARRFNDPEAEARWIVGRIKDLYGAAYRDNREAPARGLTYADFAVLLRSVRLDAEPIIRALENENVPYVVGGMNALFDTDEVDVVRSVFYFMADHPDPKNPAVTATSLRDQLKQARLGLTDAQIDAGITLLRERKGMIPHGIADLLQLQRLYLDFLEAVELREESIGRARGDNQGEIAYFNLGKFSQVVSDFEQINFHTAPKDLYPSFASFLQFQAPGYYPEGWEDAGYARPDAVQIMTVHQAKGMQWPAVFVPCLRRNRFPSGRVGGRSVWHVIPEDCVENADRYKGTVEDERRLFYVALTRAEKYLNCSWSPVPDNSRYQSVSPFFNELTGCDHILTREPTVAVIERLDPRPRKEEVTLNLTFSELKYYFECPYQFKLRFLYGFYEPVNKALGYGKSLHDALAEIHAESIKGRIPDIGEVPRLVEDHLHLPFANDVTKENLRKAAEKSLKSYLKNNGRNLTKLEHVEKVVELKLNDGIVVNGRIDLIRRTDTNEVVIVDFKSVERAQAEELSQKQLHVYAVGYEQLTGRRADLIEVHNLDKGGSLRELVDEGLIGETLQAISVAGGKLRENDLPRLPHWCGKCEECGMNGICRTKSSLASAAKR